MNARIDGRPQFDAVKFKETTRMQWEAAAEAWDRWGPFIGSWLGAATEAMLDMAAIAPGARVVDIAAGAGEQEHDHRWEAQTGRGQHGVTSTVGAVCD